MIDMSLVLKMTSRAYPSLQALLINMGLQFILLVLGLIFNAHVGSSCLDRGGCLCLVDRMEIGFVMLRGRFFDHDHACLWTSIFLFCANLFLVIWTDAVSVHDRRFCAYVHVSRGCGDVCLDCDCERDLCGHRGDVCTL
jgi:hypothetical protein